MNHISDSDQLPPPENKRYYPALDGLRAIAVLMVFAQHYFHGRPSLEWGWTGVELFFVLSGFLITGILYDTRDSVNRFKSFYARRTLRIFPLYYGVLLFALALKPIFHWVWHPAWMMWFVYLGNYSRVIWLHDFTVHEVFIDHLATGAPHKWPGALLFGHFWSLCVEEQFYLLWPLVVFKVRDRIKLRTICLWSVFVCLAMRVVCFAVLPQSVIATQVINRTTFLRADALLLGGLMALALRGPEAERAVRLAKPVMISTAAAFAAMELFYFVRTGAAYRYQDEGWLVTIGFTVIDLFAASLIMFTVTPGSFAFRIFQDSRLRWLGRISYGFYVFHDIPHHVYGHISERLWHGHHSSVVTAAIALVCTVALSYLSFRFYERPFLKLKRFYEA